MLPATGIIYGLLKSGRPRTAVLAATPALAASGWIGPGDPAPLAVPSREVSAATSASPGLLLLSGLKAGLLTFGGAYTAIPFVRNDAVGRGWISDGQFLDGLALSGVLPAPLIIFVTFVGYAGGGFPGALAMTAGVFLPALGFTLLFYERLEAVIENGRLRSVLEGVSAGVVGLIGATLIGLGRDLGKRSPDVLAAALIFAAALAALYLWKAKANVMAVVLGTGLAGWLAYAH